MVVGEKKGLLLHACCAPCATVSCDALMKDFGVSVFFFNPNIFPVEEYRKRLVNLRKLSKILGFEVFVGDYSSYDWLEFVRGHEGDVENGERCRLCFLFRLEGAAKFARDEGFDCFSTTLNVNAFKNSGDILAVGKSLEKKFGVRFVLYDFNKWAGLRKSLELAKKFGLYRQGYCGCVFSLNNKNHTKKI